MNIFVLDKDPLRAARYYIDQHIGRTILDSARILWDAHVELDGAFRWTNEHSAFSESLDINNPWTIWTRSSVANYDWLYLLFWGLIREFNDRYRRSHHYEKLCTRLKSQPRDIPVANLTECPLSMPKQYKKIDAVEAYRDYYFGEKHNIASWRSPATKPDWWKERENG